MNKIISKNITKTNKTAHQKACLIWWCIYGDMFSCCRESKSHTKRYIRTACFFSDEDGIYVETDSGICKSQENKSFSLIIPIKGGFCKFWEFKF